MIISTFLLISKMIVTYPVSSAIAYSHLKRILNSPEHSYIFIISLGIGTSLISWLFASILRFVPYQSSIFYIATIYCIIFLAGWRVRKNLWHDIYEIIQLFRSNLPSYKLDKAFLYGTLSYIFLIIVYYFWMPLLENDPLEYFHLAKIILQKKNLAFYPILDGTDTKGFIAPWTHPIGYPVFLAWNMIGLEQDLGRLSAKIGSLYFSIATLISLYLLCLKENLPFKHLAGFIFISTPICFYEAYICHIDSSRMMMFLSTAVALYLHYFYRNYYTLMIIGIQVGLAWFYHSSGLLTLLISLGIIGLFSIKKIKNVFIYSFLIFLISFLIVSPDLVNIFFKHGKILGDLDNIEVTRLLKDEFKIFMDLSRGIGTIKQAFIWGLGKVFLQHNTYGASYILLLLGSLFLFLKNKNEHNEIRLKDFLVSFSMTHHLILICIIFWLGVILSVLLKLTIFTVNPRYLLQVQPLIAFIAALQINIFLQNVVRK